MNIINPKFKIQNEENNIFEIRKKDYENILPTVKNIVEPVQEIGFTITELQLRDSRFASGELSKTIKQTLAIKLQKGSSKIDLSIFIPKLVDDNYIFINGRKKIPLFQLFDIPIVTRGENLKLRTNVATLMIFKNKQEPWISVSFMGKKVPLSLVLLAWYGPDDVKDRFDLDGSIDEESENRYENLRYDLREMLENSPTETQDDFIVELGRNYSKYNAKSKGEDIIYALDLIPKVDPMTAKHLINDDIIEELLWAMKEADVDDTLFTNKRVRCFEYMVTAKISKIIYDLCFSNRTSRQPKFNINSTQILSECNVSDIVQFDFAINPVHELTMLSRISLLGPGGFKRENIPRHLRDISPSMFGRICPVDTPDRDNCGVLQNLIPNVPLDEDLKFTEEYCERQPISIPVSMTPFLKHDDQTRLQMASSQMRQSIMLKKFDVPLIASGCEGLYSKYSQFVKVAKKDGVVAHRDAEFLIVEYSDGSIDTFKVGHRMIYVEHLDYMSVYVKEGDKFKAGDILAESNYCKDGKITIGKNLLTGVMVYLGNNYEDGIVVSDRLVKEDVLTSIHYKDLSFNITPDKVLLSLDKNKYKPLPDRFQEIQTGEPYAIMQKLNSDDYYSPFLEKQEMTAHKKFIISGINIYANDWNTEIPEYDEWIKKKLKEQESRESYLNEKIMDIFPKNQALKFIKENSTNKFSFTGKYKQKRERINGIHIEMYGVHLRPVRVGDKLANRHGNKGVISQIVEHEKMPQLPDGRHLDICINPLGIISRMNIGQLYELHMAMSVNDLKRNINKMIDEKESEEKIKEYIIEYIKIIDRTEDNWFLKQFEEQMPDKITKEFVNNFNIVQPPFESCTFDEIERAMEYTGTNFKEKLFNPIGSQEIFNEIAVGFIYFFRMVHIAEEKLAARGIGAYARRTLQPLGGRKNKGGQRCGEMESACLIGHDAPCNLFEFLTTKSDCIEMKNSYIRNFIENNLMDDEKELDMVPESVKLLNSYLTVIGVDHK